MVVDIILTQYNKYCVINRVIFVLEILELLCQEYRKFYVTNKANKIWAFSIKLHSRIFFVDQLFFTQNFFIPNFFIRKIL